MVEIVGATEACTVTAVGCDGGAAGAVALVGESAGEDSRRGGVDIVEFALLTGGFDFFARVDDVDFAGFAALGVGAVLVEVLDVAAVGSVTTACGSVDCSG